MLSLIGVTLTLFAGVVAGLFGWADIDWGRVVVVGTVLYVVWSTLWSITKNPRDP